MPEVPFAKDEPGAGSYSKYAVFMSASPFWGLK